MKRSFRAMSLLAALIASCPLLARQLVLQNDRTKLVLDDKANYAPVSMQCADTGVDLIDPKALGAKNSPWEIIFMDAESHQHTVSAATTGVHVTAVQKADAITVTWKDISLPKLEGAATFSMTVTLKDNGDTAWTYRLSGNAQAALWQVNFPIIAGVRQMAEDYLAYPYYFGRLASNPTQAKRDIMLNYPQPASMQFCTYWGTPDKRREGDSAIETGWQPDNSDATGLYFAAEDPRGCFKDICISTKKPSLKFWFQNYHGLQEWPLLKNRRYSFDEALPYPVVAQPFRGDVFTASQKYREWAQNQPWCAAGKMPEVGTPVGNHPDAIVHWKSEYQRKAAFWTKYYEAPYKVLGEWNDLQQWLRVPSPSHYYCYNIAKFDDNYPEHLPGKPYLLNGMRAAKRMGIAPQPYNNGVIWDMDTQSWFKQHGEDARRIGPGGNHRVWDIGGEYFAFMCPFTQKWQDKMRETSRKMIWEHEMSGVYLDCFAATASSKCYDPNHGHPLHGGDYFTAGNRKLMADLRKDIRGVVPDAGFFCEEICEQYLDCMDGFLTLDYLRSGVLHPGEQVFPFFNYVYNAFTLDFGSDAAIENPELNFRLQMGRLYVWGSTPLICSGTPKSPKAGDPNSEFLKDLVQGYHAYGRKLTFNADMLRISRRSIGSKAPKSSLDVQANPLAVDFSDWRKTHKWNGPAVLSSAFRKQGTITLLLVNASSETQNAILTADGTLFDGKPAKTARILWPKQAAIAPVGENAISLPVNTTAIVTFCKDANAPAPEPEPFLPMDWTLVHQKAKGPFPSVSLPDNGKLLACDDAVVDIVFSPAPNAAMRVYDDNGKLAPRIAYDPAEAAKRLPGKSTDRRRVGQPFALLHQLPVTAKNAKKVTVLSGDTDFIAAVVTPNPGNIGFTLDLPADAIVACANLNGGNPRILGRFAAIRNARPQDFGLDPAKPLVFGAAVFSKTTLNEAFCLSGAFGIDATALKAAADAFLAKPGNASLAKLADAMQAWFVASASFPALFAPQAPGFTLLAQLAALQTPFRKNAGQPAAVLADDDWLAPGIPRELRLVGSDGTTRVCLLGAWKTPAGISPVKGNAVTVTVTDFDYIERLVPVTAWTRLPGCGWHPAITWLECNQPYDLQTQPRPVTVLNGMTATADVTISNWSTLPLTVVVNGNVNAPGFDIMQPEPVSIAPRTKATVNVTVKCLPEALGGSYNLNITANHLGDARAQTVGIIRLNVMEILKYMDGDASASPERKPPLLRGIHQYATYVKKGETLKLALAVSQKTIYKDGMSWKLLDSAMKELMKGTVAWGEEREVTFNAPQSGMVMLVCDSKLGAGTVVSSTHPLSEAVMDAVPMQLFCSRIERFFYVKKGAESFKLGVTDGGLDETAAIKLVSPTGRTVMDRNGNWSQEVIKINVKPDEAGKAWKLIVNPVQDVSLRLSEGVAPWLSHSPNAVLKGND